MKQDLTKITVTRSDDRGLTRIGWLDSRHSFSFGGYYDSERMGFGPLRVVNDDRIAPGSGFPAHPHRDMEIVSIALEGQLEHKDSMGNGSIIEPGEIQYMSAGTGVTHSEFNPSSENPAHFMQIWIQPDQAGYEPRYGQRKLEAAASNEWGLVLSQDGRGGSIGIRQDVELRIAHIDSGAVVSYDPLRDGRGLWLFVLEGSVVVAGEEFEQGDSVAIPNAGRIDVGNSGDLSARVLLFDVPVSE